MNINLDALITNLRTGLPSFALLQALNHVPAFVEVRARLTLAYASMWQRPSERLGRLAEQLTAETDLKAEMERIEKELNQDPELGRLWRSYPGDVARITAPLGSPKLLGSVMFQEDWLNLPGVVDMRRRASGIALSSGSRAPGSWPAWVRHLVNDALMTAGGVDSAAELLVPRVAAEWRRRIDNTGRLIHRRVTRPDPLPPLGYWIRVKVLEETVAEVADKEYQTLEWVQDQVQRANRLLRTHQKPGRPSKANRPISVWNRMEFQQPGNGGVDRTEKGPSRPPS